MVGQLHEPPQLALNTNPFPRQEHVLLSMGDPPYCMLRQRVHSVLLPFPNNIIELFSHSQTNFFVFQTRFPIHKQVVWSAEAPMI